MSNNLMQQIKNRIAPRVPDILFGVGVAGVLGGTAAIAAAAFTLPQMIEEYKQSLADLEALPMDEAIKMEEMKTLKREFIWNVTKHFGVPVAIELLSLFSMFCGYKKVKTISAELAAVAAGYDAVMKSYRARVQQEVGEEKEEQLWLGGQTIDTVTVTGTDENGNDIVEQKTETIYDQQLPSMYARWFTFGEASGAEKDLDYNGRFLQIQQEMATTYLHANKVLYLNDVYQWLGIKRSVAGNRVGWVYDKTKPIGDNVVDLRARLLKRKNEFGEYEMCWMIDPNVDGVIDDRALAKGLITN